MPSLDDRLRAVADILKTVAWMKEVGFDATTTNKIARETVHFAWERGPYGQWDIRRPHSQAARQARSTCVGAFSPGRAGVTYDHPVPLNLLWPHLLKAHQDDAVLKSLLLQFVRPVVITLAEDATLTAAGLQYAMPTDWDRRDVSARYTQVGITFLPDDLRILTE